jgi:hypothetical protein
MPIATLQLTPGINVELTPTLNAAGYTSSQLIRWRDGLPEKIGGWSRYYASNFNTAVRNLHAWKDLSETSRLAVGSLDALSLINSDGSLSDITPLGRTDDVAVDVSTTSGSNIVTITDVGSNAGVNDVIEIRTPIAVGGLILKGVYRIETVLSVDQFTILAASNATSTVASGGAVPSFAATSGSTSVTVTLTAHGLSVGDTFPFLASTTVGGLTVQGLYTVVSVPTANTFTISFSYQATSTATVSMNGGDAQYYFFVAAAPPPAGAGYGTGGYGTGGYGTGVAPAGGNGTTITAVDWSLDNWGSILIASPGDGALYTWQSDSDIDNAAVIPEAPTSNKGFFVAMPQQQIVVYGASVLGVKDPLLVAWCDVGDFNTWAAQTTNQAGTFRIPRGSEIRAGRQTALQGLLWTDLAVWAMQYVGPDSVYGFQELGNGCGIISEYAHAAINGVVVWMGERNFYALSGGSVQVLACTVWDAVFQNLNRDYVDNIRAGSNSQFDEFWWFYPSSASADGENDSYVKFNARLNVWDFGSLARSAWIDQSVLGAPIAAGARQIYQHETGYNDVDGPIVASFTSGYFAIAEGNRKVFVDLVWPDFKFDTYDGNDDATIQITFFVTDYPKEPPTVFGPHPVTAATEWVNVRMRGRLMAINVQSADLSSFWRLGALRYRYAEAGIR